MDIPLQLSFKNMDHSDAVEARVREKATKLEQYFSTPDQLPRGHRGAAPPPPQGPDISRKNRNGRAEKIPSWSSPTSRSAIGPMRMFMWPYAMRSIPRRAKLQAYARKDGRQDQAPPATGSRQLRRQSGMRKSGYRFSARIPLSLSRIDHVS